MTTEYDKKQALIGRKPVLCEDFISPVGQFYLLFFKQYCELRFWRIFEKNTPLERGQRENKIMYNSGSTQFFLLENTDVYIFIMFTFLWNTPFTIFRHSQQLSHSKISGSDNVKRDFFPSLLYHCDRNAQIKSLVSFASERIKRKK